MAAGLLIAEPQRHPASVCTLNPTEVAQAAACCLVDLLLHSLADIRVPFGQGSDCVCGNIRTALVKRELAPAFAEGGHAAIPVLQIEQPVDAQLGRLGRGVVKRAEPSQCQQGTGGIVGIRDRTRQIRPAPTTSRRMGEGVLGLGLAAKEPIQNALALVGCQFDAPVVRSSQCLDSQGGHPGCQVGVDWPATVVA